MIDYRIGPWLDKQRWHGWGYFTTIPVRLFVGAMFVLAPKMVTEALFKVVGETITDEKQGH